MFPDLEYSRISATDEDCEFPAELLGKYNNLKSLYAKLEDKLQSGDSDLSDPEYELVLAARSDEISTLRQEWAEVLLERHALRLRLSAKEKETFLQSFSEQLPQGTTAARDGSITPIAGSVDSSHISSRSASPPSAIRRSRSAQLSEVHSQIQTLREELASQSAMEKEINTACKDAAAAQTQCDSHKATLERLKGEYCAAQANGGYAGTSTAAEEDVKELEATCNSQEAMIVELRHEIRAAQQKGEFASNKSAIEELRSQCKGLEEELVVRNTQLIKDANVEPVPSNSKARANQVEAENLERTIAELKHEVAVDKVRFFQEGELAEQREIDRKSEVDCEDEAAPKIWALCGSSVGKQRYLSKIKEMKEQLEEFQWVEESTNEEMSKALEELKSLELRSKEIENANRDENDELQTLKMLQARFLEDREKCQEEVEETRYDVHRLAEELVDVHANCGAELAAKDAQYSKFKTELAVASKEHNLCLAKNAEEERVAAYLRAEVVAGQDGIGMLRSEIAQISSLALLVESRIADPNRTMLTELDAFRSEAEEAERNVAKEEAKYQELEDIAQEQALNADRLEMETMAAEAESQKLSNEVETLRLALRTSEEDSARQSHVVSELNSQLNEMGVVRAQALSTSQSSVTVESRNSTKEALEVIPENCEYKEVTITKEALEGDTRDLPIQGSEASFLSTDAVEPLQMQRGETQVPNRSPMSAQASFLSTDVVEGVESPHHRQGGETRVPIQSHMSAQGASPSIGAMKARMPKGVSFVDPGPDRSRDSATGPFLPPEARLPLVPIDEVPAENTDEVRRLKDEVDLERKAVAAKEEAIAAQSVQVREELMALRRSICQGQLPQQTTYSGLDSQASTVAPVKYMQSHVIELEKLVSCMIEQRVQEREIVDAQIRALENPNK